MAAEGTVGARGLVKEAVCPREAVAVGDVDDDVDALGVVPGVLPGVLPGTVLGVVPGAVPGAVGEVGEVGLTADEAPGGGVAVAFEVAIDADVAETAVRSRSGEF